LLLVWVLRQPYEKWIQEIHRNLSRIRNGAPETNPETMTIKTSAQELSGKLRKMRNQYIQSS